MPELIKGILNSTLKKMGLNKKIKEKRVLKLWSVITGKRISLHTEAKYINQGVLFVTVDNSAWANELLFMKEDLVKRLNDNLGKKIVKDIRFKTGTIKQQKKNMTKNKSKKQEKINLKNQEKQEILAELDFLKDEELKNKIFKLMILDKKTKKWRKNNGWKNCPICSTLIKKDDKKCVICKLKEKEIDYKEISRFIYNNPWLSYANIKNTYPNLLEEDFERIKEKLNKKIKNKIDYLIPKALKKEINNQKLKVKIQNYAMLKTEIPPNKLNNKLIEQVIGKEYMTIYKQL